MTEFTNKDIAVTLKKIASLMELNGENKYKVRAYYNAARRLAELENGLDSLINEDKLEEINGIGKGIASTIKEIYTSGYSLLLEELQGQIPADLMELLKIPGLGPVRIHQLHVKLDINNLDDLKRALEEGKIRKLKGYGPRSEERLIKGLKDYEKYRQVHILYKALLKAEEIKSYLEDFKDLRKIETVGSLRRYKELIKEIDLLAVSKSGLELSDFFVNLPFVKEVIIQEPGKVSIMTEDSFQANLRIVNEEEYPTALQYYTGSREHNLGLRERAKDCAYILRESGLFKGEKRLELKEERELYQLLDLDYIIPELRENMGELEAAAEGRLPDSIGLTDIKGDLHLHTRYTDGAYSIKDLVETARKRAYQYIAITDHSRSLKVARGMSIETLLSQLEEIDALQKEYSDIKIFKGIEVDIDSEGRLDYPDEILARLDLVIASIHSGFNQSKKQITERITRAMENPHVNIIGHLRGRIFKRREPYPVDIERVIQVARKTGTCLEINASPYRLDIDDLICRQAKENGVKIAINTDAHHLVEFDNMLLGVAVARRGWLERSDVINAMQLEELSRFLSHNDD